MPVTKANGPPRFTWRDLLEPGAPDPEPLLTRAEFLERLRAEGVNVNARALAHWENLGVIPRGVRRWRAGGPKSLYPEFMIPIVRAVRTLQRNGQRLADIRETILTVAWMAPTVTTDPSADLADQAARWRAYSNFAESTFLRALLDLTRLRQRADGTPLVDVEVRFLGADGQLYRHSFGTPPVWDNTDDNTDG